jgi:multidrug efflux pump subunit AcrA (membrane-fusion protein)
VIVFAGVEKVMTVEDGTAHERRIRTGARTGDRIEVLDGLTDGAVVIVNGSSVADGSPVTIAER